MSQLAIHQFSEKTQDKIKIQIGTYQIRVLETADGKSTKIVGASAGVNIPKPTKETIYEKIKDFITNESENIDDMKLIMKSDVTSFFKDVIETYAYHEYDKRIKKELENREYAKQLCDFTPEDLYKIFPIISTKTTEGDSVYYFIRDYQNRILSRLSLKCSLTSPSQIIAELELDYANEYCSKLDEIRAKVAEVYGSTDKNGNASLNMKEFVITAYDKWKRLDCRIIDEVKPISHNEDEWCFTRLKLKEEQIETPFWNGFINRINPESRDLLKGWLWNLFDPNNKSRQLMYLWGKGNTGKDTFLRTIRKIIGETYCTTWADEGDSFGRANYPYSVLISDSECETPWIHSTPTVKKITGGSPVYINIKNQNAFSARVRAKLIFISNTAPIVNTTKPEETSRIIIANLSPLEKKDKLNEDIVVKEMIKEFPSFLYNDCKKSADLLLEVSGNLDYPVDYEQMVFNKYSAKYVQSFMEFTERHILDKRPINKEDKENCRITDYQFMTGLSNFFKTKSIKSKDYSRMQEATIKDILKNKLKWDVVDDVLNNGMVVGWFIEGKQLKKNVALLEAFGGNDE